MKKYILLVALILIIGVTLFVSARMTFTYEDDGIYNLYNNEIILEKGWNLINFGQELQSDSEIKQGDIKAIFYYNPSNKQYVRYFPESQEWKDLTSQNSCGDQSCNPEERESYANWCYKDCKFELNDDIISNLNVISQKTVTLKKDVKENIDFSKYYDLQIYWNQNSVSGSCADRGYSNVDCVMLHHDITSKGLNNDNEFINSLNDGNPYNDRFGIAHSIGTYTDQESVIYAKVDYGSSKDEYKIIFYEIDDNRVKTGSNELPIPSVQAKIVSQPAWVYSTKQGLLKTESVLIKLSQNPLQAGWNFITITPDMNGKSLNQLKGNCNIFDSYIWDASGNKWYKDSKYLDAYFENKWVGTGMIIKVSDKCNLGTTENSNIPSVPNLP